MSEVRRSGDPAESPHPSDADRGFPPRDQIIEAAIGEFRRKAFYEVSLESVAHAAGIRRGEITWHFPTWEDLVKATIDAWNSRYLSPLLPIAGRSGAVPLLRAITVSHAADPALMRLLVATVNIAATPEQPLSAWLRSTFDAFYDLVRTTLARDIEAGREPATMDPTRGAEQLIAIYEGLQIQSLVRADMDLVAAYDRGVTRLRRGWADDYQPPVWDTVA